MISVKMSKELLPHVVLYAATDGFAQQDIFRTEINPNGLLISSTPTVGCLFTIRFDHSLLKWDEVLVSLFFSVLRS